MNAKMKTLAIRFAKVCILLLVLSAPLMGQVMPKHKDLHRANEPDWWDGVEIDFIILSGRTGRNMGRLIYYKNQEDFKKGNISEDIEWDENTLFFGLQTQKKFYPNGCFVILHCRAHKMAYFLEQFECSKWEAKP